MAFGNAEIDAFEDALDRKDNLVIAETIARHGQDMIASGYLKPETFQRLKATASAKLKETYGLPARPQIGLMDRALMTAQPDRPIQNMVDALPGAPAAGYDAAMANADQSRAVGQAPGMGQVVAPAVKNNLGQLAGLLPYLGAGAAGMAVAGTGGAALAPLALMGGSFLGEGANVAMGQETTDPKTGQSRPMTMGDAAESVNLARPLLNVGNKVSQYGMKEGLGRAAYDGDLLGSALTLDMARPMAEAAGRKVFGKRAPAEAVTSPAQEAAPARPAEADTVTSPQEETAATHRRMQGLQRALDKAKDQRLTDTANSINFRLSEDEPVSPVEVDALERELRTFTPASREPGQAPDPYEPGGDAELYQRVKTEKETALRSAMERGDVKTARALRREVRDVSKWIDEMPSGPFEPGQPLVSRAEASADPLRDNAPPIMNARLRDEALAKLPGPIQQMWLAQEPPGEAPRDIPASWGPEDALPRRGGMPPAPQAPAGDRWSGPVDFGDRQGRAYPTPPDVSQQGPWNGPASFGPEDARPPEDLAGLMDRPPDRAPFPRPPAVSLEGPWDREPHPEEVFAAIQTLERARQAAARKQIGPGTGAIEQGPVPLPPPNTFLRERGGLEYPEGEGPLRKPPAEVIQPPAERPDTFNQQPKVNAASRLFGKKKALLAAGAVAASSAYSYLTATDDEERDRAKGLMAAAAIPFGTLTGAHQAAAEAITPMESQLRVASHPSETLHRALSAGNFEYNSIPQSSFAEKAGIPDAAIEQGQREFKMERAAHDYVVDGGYKNIEAERVWADKLGQTIWRAVKKTIQKRVLSPQEFRELRNHPDVQKIHGYIERLRNYYQAMYDALEPEGHRDNYYPNTAEQLTQRVLDNERTVEGQRGPLDESSLNHRREFENYDPNESFLDTYLRYEQAGRNKSRNVFIGELSTLEKRLRGAGKAVEADNVASYINNSMHHQAGYFDRLIKRSVLQGARERAGSIQVGQTVDWDGRFGFPEGKVEVDADAGEGTRGHNWYVKVNGERWPVPLTGEQIAYMDLAKTRMGRLEMIDNPVSKVVGSLTRAMSAKYILGNMRTFFSAIPENASRMASGETSPFSRQGIADYSGAIEDVGRLVRAKLDGNRGFLDSEMRRLEGLQLMEGGKLRLDNDAPAFEWMERLNHSWPARLAYLNVSAPDFVSKLGTFYANARRIARENPGWSQDRVDRGAMTEVMKITDMHHTLLQSPGTKNGLYQMATYLKKSTLRSATHVAKITQKAARGNWAPLVAYLGVNAGIGLGTIKAMGLDKEEYAELFSRYLPFADLWLKAPAQAAGLTPGNPADSVKTSFPIYDFVTGSALAVPENIREASELGDWPTQRTQARLPFTPRGTFSALARTVDDLIGMVQGDQVESHEKNLMISPSLKNRPKPPPEEQAKRQRLKEIRRRQEDEE